MGNNVAPGDRAIIIGSVACPENLGCVVEVVRAYEQGEVLPGHTGPYDRTTSVVWVIESLGRPLYLLQRSTSGDTTRPTVPVGAALDKALRRLPDLDEGVDLDLELTALLVT